MSSSLSFAPLQHHVGGVGAKMARRKNCKNARTQQRRRFGVGRTAVVPSSSAASSPSSSSSSSETTKKRPDGFGFSAAGMIFPYHVGQGWQLGTPLFTHVIYHAAKTRLN
jgi:hypothetical protein